VVYKRLLIRLPHSIEVADLAEADIPGLKSHVADVRSLPFAPDSFDLAICLSTLEHVGMDNAQYKIESGGGDDVNALHELGRVARRVLVTVPAGVDDDMGWQRQYSLSRFRRVVDGADLVIEHLEIFAHDSVNGWAPADEDEVSLRTYMVTVQSQQQRSFALS
jgi:Methyltransferase domain